ncbi:MAG: helix-turn-helix domain-containing protein [Clostridia bacterium]|nr:helix-turn-helix domain-containing protein [Clostridia bacterium]
MFSEKLKKMREDAGLTQAELGKALGISVRTVQNYESANVVPKKPERIYRIAKFFNVPAEYLFSEEDYYLTVLGKTSITENQKHYIHLLEDINALYCGGTLSAEDRDSFIAAINAMYLESSGI